MNNILDFVKSLPTFHPTPFDKQLVYIFRGHKCMIMDSSDIHVTFRCIDPNADIGAGVGQDFTVTLNDKFNYVIHEDYITLIHGDLKLNVHKQMFSDLFIFLLKTNMTIQEMEKVWLSYNTYNF